MRQTGAVMEGCNLESCESKLGRGINHRMRLASADKAIAWVSIFDTYKRNLLL